MHYKILRRTKICIMRLASGCVVMFFWSAVCVRALDRPSLNSSSDKDIHTNPSPCFIQIGDVPYTKCDPGSEDVFNSRPENDTIPVSSSAVPESVPTTLVTTAINSTSTTTAVTPTAHPSSKSPDETKFTTETPTQSPVIVGETHEDGRNETESTNCASVRMGINTEVYLLVVCGVLMLILATLSFCLYKQCKKQSVENPNLTRLISIPNPAFSNP